MADHSVRDASPLRSSPPAVHLVTCEYPPRIGGVGDYTRALAVALGAAGVETHVWCPTDAAAGPDPGVELHPVYTRFSPRELASTDRALGLHPGPRRLVVQWVPHGYGYRSLNLAMALWLWRRAHSFGDRVELVVHEPFLEFTASPRRAAAALVHRGMIAAALAAASRVWCVVPAWEALLRPYSMRRDLEFDWLPAPSTIAVTAGPEDAARVRARVAPTAALLLGHFSTCGGHVAEDLRATIPRFLAGANGRTALLIGRDSVELARAIAGEHPSLRPRIVATGALPATEISAHLMACDMLLQPVRGGVSSRNTSVLAGLAHGKALVAVSGTLTEPVWDASGSVLLARDGDHDSLSSALERLAGDASLRRRLGARARAFYGATFGIDLVADRLMTAWGVAGRSSEMESRCASSS